MNFRAKVFARAPAVNRIAGYFKQALRLSLASAFFDEGHNTMTKV
ncbi:hypothetical protein NOC27_155 [Nitrosococcus oceani AFC27]|nr:hypothetical protein NOC27_155 [Nitrosococcus oceani AFC27]